MRQGKCRLSNRSYSCSWYRWNGSKAVERRTRRNKVAPDPNFYRNCNAQIPTYEFKRTDTHSYIEI